MKKLPVRRKGCLLPNGCRTWVEMVEHPGAVVVIPLLAPGQVVMLRQFRPAIGRYLYELPAGTIEAPETPAACVRREIIEETGYAAGSIRRLGSIYPVPGYSTEKIVIFEAKDLKKRESCLEDDEVIASRAMTRAQVRRLFARGALLDAKTICAFVMCRWL